ncbi:hypothetical protein [Pseudomonas sp. xss_2]|uniref:hypothetical protein n=1 Tax=Pseudomonas sp. xss_2 TaxID=3367215 RepID=UPI00370C635D
MNIKVGDSGGIVVIGEELTVEEQIVVAQKNKQSVDAQNAALLSRVRPQGKMAGTTRQGGQVFNVAPAFTIESGVVTPDIQDGRPNTITRDAHFAGPHLRVNIPTWPSTIDPSQDPLDFVGTFDQVIFFSRPLDAQDSSRDVQYTPPSRPGVPPRPLLEVPFPPTEASYSLTLTPDFLNWLERQRGEGLYNIYYSVANSSEGNLTSSPLHTLFLDLRSPSFNVQPGPLQVPNGLTEPIVLDSTWFSNNPTTDFPLRLANSAQPGDRIEVMVGGRVIHQAVQWPVNPDGSFLPDPIPTVSIPRAALEGLPQGRSELRYVLTDRAGWPSQESLPLEVTVDVAAIPTVLPAPIIEAARVDRETARNGLGIRVEDIAGAQPGDRILMRLIRPFAIDPPGDNPNGNVVTLPEFLYGSTPRSTIARWAQLAVARLFGQSHYTLNVEYTLFRGTRNLGTSPRATVDLDLRTVGPGPNPGDLEEGPVNTALVPVTVSGAVDQLPNEITANDGGADADITFTYYQGLAAGHVVRFFYDGEELPNPLTLSGTEVVGDTVVVPLSNAVFRRIGSGQKPIFYQVYLNGDAINAGNFQRSPTTTVTVRPQSLTVASYVQFVNAFFTAPGQTEVSVQDRRPGSLVAETGAINCDAYPWLGINLRITDPTLVVGDTVRITLRYSTGTRALNLVAQQYSFDHPVTQVDVNNRGINHTVPYAGIRFEQAAEPLSGSFVSSYTVTNATGDTGNSRVSMIRYAVSNFGVRCGNWGSPRTDEAQRTANRQLIAAQARQ